MAVTKVKTLGGLVADYHSPPPTLAVMSKYQRGYWTKHPQMVTFGTPEVMWSIRSHYRVDLNLNNEREWRDALSSESGILLWPPLAEPEVNEWGEVTP